MVLKKVPTVDGSKNLDDATPTCVALLIVSSLNGAPLVCAPLRAVEDFKHAPAQSQVHPLTEALLVAEI